MLPSVDGIDVLKWIRKDNSTPVIMFTVKGETLIRFWALNRSR